MKNVLILCIKKLGRKIASLFFFTGLLFPCTLRAAAWLQPQGDTLVIANVRQYTSCQYWDINGSLQHGDCFRQFSVNPYMEYGADSKLTLLFSPNFNEFSQSGESVPFGFENAIIGGRYSLWQKDWSTFSAQLQYNQPIRTSSFGSSDTPSSNYALINRQRYIDARLLFGTGGAFDKQQENTWYADAEGAYQENFNGAADEFHVDFMLGWKTLGGRLIYELQELNSVTLNNPRNLNVPNYDLVSLMPSVIYWFTLNSWALQVGVSQDVYGTNIGQGTAPFVAVWLKL